MPSELPQLLGKNMEKAWINPKKSRYYAARVESDLFGFPILDCHWGSTVTNRHGGQMKVFKNLAEAQEAIEKLNKKRLKRGYDLISNK